MGRRSTQHSTVSINANDRPADSTHSCQRFIALRDVIIPAGQDKRCIHDEGTTSSSGQAERTETGVEASKGLDTDQEHVLRGQENLIWIDFGPNFTITYWLVPFLWQLNRTCDQTSCNDDANRILIHICR